MRFLAKQGWMVAAAMLVFAGTAAASQSAPGTLTCMTSPDSTGTTSSLTTQVSSYSVGIQTTVSIGSATGGAGAGKVTPNPADLHISLSKFTDFFQYLVTGRVLAQCTLVSTAANGVTATFTFQTVEVSSVTAVTAEGNGSNATAFTDLQLVYGTLSVSMTNPVDDGGTEADDK